MNCNKKMLKSMVKNVQIVLLRCIMISFVVQNRSSWYYWCSTWTYCWKAFKMWTATRWWYNSCVKTFRHSSRDVEWSVLWSRTFQAGTIDVLLGHIVKNMWYLNKKKKFKLWRWNRAFLRKKNFAYVHNYWITGIVIS